MSRLHQAALAALTLTLLAGCATTPSGPSVMALPGSGESFDQFRHDDALCREYAREQTGGTDASEAARDAGTFAASDQCTGRATGASAPASAPALPGRANAPYPPPPPGHQPPAASAPPAAAQSGRGNWYYCASAREYYPYVRTCREGWQVVEASPPPFAALKATRPCGTRSCPRARQDDAIDAAREHRAPVIHGVSRVCTAPAVQNP